MDYKLELSVFRFDATTDFLPYYQKFFITIDANKSVDELLMLISKMDASFCNSKNKPLAIKINNQALFCNELMDGIVKAFGTSLTLEPLSTKRAVKDMVIDTADFDAKFSLLEPYIDENEKELFNSYLPFHYTSPILGINEEYLGDAFFAFAYDMLLKYPENRQYILELVADEQKGIFLHTKLCKKNYPCGKEVEDKIIALKNEVLEQIPQANNTVKKLSQLINAL